MYMCDYALIDVYMRWMDTRPDGATGHITYEYEYRVRPTFGSFRQIGGDLF